MRSYVLLRGAVLSPEVFSSLKKAKDYAKTRYPFVRRWDKVRPFSAFFIRRVPQWRGFSQGSQMVPSAVIYSVVIQ